DDDDDPLAPRSYGFAPQEERSASPDPAPPPPPPKPRKKRKPVDVASLPPLTTNDPPLWRRHLHWLLVLALIPLVVSLLGKDEAELLDSRIDESLKDFPEEEREQILDKIRSDRGIDLDDLDDLCKRMPRGRIQGSLLSRTSKGHWLIAL